MAYSFLLQPSLLPQGYMVWMNIDFKVNVFAPSFETYSFQFGLRCVSMPYESVGLFSTLIIAFHSKKTALKFNPAWLPSTIPHHAATPVCIPFAEINVVLSLFLRS